MKSFLRKLQKIKRDEKYAKSAKAPKGSPADVVAYFSRRSKQEKKHGVEAAKLLRKYK